MIHRDSNGNGLRGAPDWKSQLGSAIKAYDDQKGHYDEVFEDVGRSIQANGYATRSDIAIIGCWKRSVQGRWIGRLLARPEGEVRNATHKAFRAGDDNTALRALATLPGFQVKGPIATALLCAHDPDRYAVMDRRAWSGLVVLGLSPDRGRGETLRYLARARELRDEMHSGASSVTARDIDKGLYMLGEPQSQDTA